MKKKLKYIVMSMLVLCVTIITTACTNGLKENNAPDETKKVTLKEKDETIYVGFAIDTLKEERWYKDKSLFEDQVRKLGAEVKTLAANGIDEVQIKQAELLIEEGVDVLVVVPHDAEVSAKIVEIAHKAGVKVISYDRLIKNAEVDYYISFDNVKVGEIQASEILKKQSTGNFAYIGGAESDNNAILFREGAMKVLQPLIDSGKIKLVFDQYTDEWKPTVAETNMKTALKKTNRHIDAVVAANDGTAGGVINALKEVKLAGKIPVSGQDAELEGVKRVANGTQTMTVYKPINLLASKAAELSVMVAKGEKIKAEAKTPNGKIDVPSILLEPIAVTKENIKDTIVKDGYLNEEEIYKAE
ncbi:sugar ABC transporter substrate-binding protein [Bacillus massilinigeriensis]|uniref:sugar ABC transporter substrate-binding protein n=1 Tax=Bacillus massilionigeriensis TaxID=1805475 RepID=UPI00096B10ED|nr:substrate-binding domain-containing protein [Bacillus massilionigeriensis]